MDVVCRDGGIVTDAEVCERDIYYRNFPNSGGLLDIYKSSVSKGSRLLHETCTLKMVAIAVDYHSCSRRNWIFENMSQCSLRAACRSSFKSATT